MASFFENFKISSPLIQSEVLSIKDTVIEGFFDALKVDVQSLGSENSSQEIYVDLLLPILEIICLHDGDDDYRVLVNKLYEKVFEKIKIAPEKETAEMLLPYIMVLHYAVLLTCTPKRPRRVYSAFLIHEIKIREEGYKNLYDQLIKHIQKVVEAWVIGYEYGRPRNSGFDQERLNKVGDDYYDFIETSSICSNKINFLTAGTSGACAGYVIVTSMAYTPSAPGHEIVKKYYKKMMGIGIGACCIAGIVLRAYS